MTVQMQVSAGEERSTVAGMVTRVVLWLAVATAGAIAFYWDGLASLGVAWTRPEYSYGPLVPVITAYLTLEELRRRPLRPDFGKRTVGIIVVLAALAIGLLGNVVKIPDIITYGFILYVGGIILLAAGTREGWRFWPGWLHLIFMLPLPQFLYLHVSTDLQWLSSEIGVAFIQFVGIPVYLDGNIIDLGIYKLQVAEACSGLRYLFPLFSFGWIIAVLYQGPKWHKILIFLSTIPITILMNSFRIGMIGIMVNSYGIEQAEGFLHYFEGWVIFLSCTAILYLEAHFLMKFALFGQPRPAHVLRIDFDGLFQPLRSLRTAGANRAFMSLSVVGLAAGLLWQFQQPSDSAIEPDRTRFLEFPERIGEWRGQSRILEKEIERVLAADDYLTIDYAANGQQLNLFMTFYNSQVEGSGIHSPEICIPGGGWEVSAWKQVPVSVDTGERLAVVNVNRALIRRGLERQLVYYWFEQRGRRTTNDFTAKFLTIWDSALNGRTDGGLVRLITPVGQVEDLKVAEKRLASFMENIVPALPAYFPPLAGEQ